MATSAVFRFLLSPSRIIPQRTVRDIREIDFLRLRELGYDSIVFDKDNCLTVPHQDKLVPVLRPAFSEALKVFTPQRVLIVSNSSGTTSEDPGFLEAENVERELGCHVLRHIHKKPSEGCAREIERHFMHLHPPPDPPSNSKPRLVLIGDRLLTDMLLANDMGAYGIWTTRLWQREAMGLRALERGLLSVVRGWRFVRRYMANHGNGSDSKID